MRILSKKGMIVAGLFYASIQVQESLAADFEYNVGADTGIASYSYKDGQGESQSESFFFPIALFAELQTSRVNKFVVGWREFDNEKIEASRSGDMGVALDGYQLETSFLRKFRVSRHFKPWLGIGIRSSFIERKARHTIDDEGFLLESFENEDDTLLALTLRGTHSWEVGEGWYFDSTAAFDLPTGDGLQGLGVSVGIKYELY